MKQLEHNSIQYPDTLETRAARVGQQLASSFSGLLDAIAPGHGGPVTVARLLGVDKVLASRLLKAARNRDPVAVLQLMPGPDPLRRVLRAATRHAEAEVLANAQSAVTEFEDLIRREAGDRSALEAMLSAWLPESRREFELRRKQAAYRAMSQLRGASAKVSSATVFLHPSPDPKRLDVVWVFGLLGLQRLRPDVAVKFATRRVTNKGGPPRRPETLDGVAVDGLDGLRLTEFCSAPAVEIDVHRVGEVVHYALGRNGFGPRSATDLVFAEVSRADMARFVPAGSGRRRYVFAEVSTPVETLVFDTLLHEDLLLGEPSLHIYDTSFEGVADVNDRSRDIDRLDLHESIQPLGAGLARFRTTDSSRHVDLLRLVCGKLGWDGDRFRGYRTRIEYPVYGTQVAMAFPAPSE
ncbi:MAG: hypothetical protein HZB38_00675 [Planctomycetes bacterium]|nr:hypothetical protein [Planctomycetota bacterium]